MREPVDGATRRRIAAMLDEIERTHDVRVLLAVESGSRAWGFPSPDSDYDVRFLYVRRLARYLSIVPPSEVIELPIAEDLDINGWDLRKALSLISRSNAVIQEWLTSPIRYRFDANVRSRLLELANQAGRLGTFEYHYDRLARRHFAGNETAADGVAFKRYLYALRPAMALLWLHQRRTLPPMDLPALMDGLDLPSDVQDETIGLVARKAKSEESAATARIPGLDAFIGSVLSRKAPRPGRLELDEAVVERCDRLFASLVMSSPGPRCE